MLEEYPIFLSPFQAERMIRVYLPKGYEQNEQNYPVLYIHDGKNVFRDEVAVGGVSLDLENYLDASGLNLIVVGIDANPDRKGRVNEYCPWKNGEFSYKILETNDLLGGRGQSYLDFIVNELKPAVDRNYRTLREKTFMAGISLGGLITTYAACCHPDVFTRVAGISSGFYRNQEEIENLLRRSDLSSIERFYLDCGTQEGGADQTASREFASSNMRVYEILKTKVSNTKFQIVEGAGHNYQTFRERIPEIFSFLLNDG